MKLRYQIILEGKIVTKTGLMIGTGREAFEIGGVDNPVIKDPNGKPYIPGSSIKGKMRALIERTRDLTPLKEARLKIAKLNPQSEQNRIKQIEKQLEEDHNWHKVGIAFIHICDDPNCGICNVFGRPGEKATAEPTRLYVRDARLDEEAFKEMFPELHKLSEYTEVKWENVIDRVTSAATPRQNERVPAGARFDFEMIYNVYDERDKGWIMDVFVKGMEMLENSYIGASGSRGYGKIKFENMKLMVWDSEARKMETISEAIGDLKELEQTMQQVIGKLQV